VDTSDRTGRDLSTRPEIAVALNGERTSGTRRSDTLDTDLLYVAVPVASGGIVHGAVRVTLDTHEVAERIRSFWVALAGIGAVVLAAVAGVGWVLARSVTRPVRHLRAIAARFAAGDLAPADPPVGAVPELRELAGTFNAMAARLDGLLAEQRAFVADASHQLRTPLTAMRLRLDNLEHQRDSPGATEIEALGQEVDRLSSIVADLLRLARAEQHHAPVTVDLGRLTTERVDTWTAVAEPRHIDLELDGPRSHLLVTAVPGAVEQMLDNLLDNALCAAPSGSTITVGLAAGDTHHHLRVADHGPGLTEDQKAHAANRFWKADPASSGSGLGLAIVAALTAASDGSMSLGDTTGGGLTVTVSLPSGDRPTAAAVPQTHTGRPRRSIVSDVTNSERAPPRS
jgi:signal transduction histidine kinase